MSFRIPSVGRSVFFSTIMILPSPGNEFPRRRLVGRSNRKYSRRPSSSFRCELDRRLVEMESAALPVDGLSRTPFGEAGDAARGILVGHRAAAQDGSGRERPRFGDVCDEIEERKVHRVARVRISHETVVQDRPESQVDAPVAPSVTELVRSHGERREGRRRFRTEEPEPLLEFDRDELTVSDVVRQRNEPDEPGRVLWRDAARSVAENDRDLGLEIESPTRDSKAPMGPWGRARRRTLPGKREDPS